MPDVLPRIRFNLEFLPSTDPARPGLVIRDPYHYSDSTLLVPPLLVQALNCFDGLQTDADLRAELVRLSGQLVVEPQMRQMRQALDEAGFLENDTYRELKAAKEAEFAAELERPAVFAGSAYPSDGAELNVLLEAQLGSATGVDGAMAVASPHASPEAGWRTYRAAYSRLPVPERARDLTFVILGTSHYGAPERFGLTRKAFVTPFGASVTNTTLVDELESRAPMAIRVEDYCHRVEHSIEFQVVFLQHLYGPAVRILPILCGPFVSSLYESRLPEANEQIARFFDVLGDIAAREGNRLFWVLGVDLAHIGLRYGDEFAVHAGSGYMADVSERDHHRIAQIASGNSEAYWSLVREKQDDLKWCGAAPFYTFLKVIPKVQGRLLDYHQWQIDPQSVVSFCALEFRR